jgi:inhibitor of KinA sporulation pathway (predicted exonuclease)
MNEPLKIVIFDTEYTAWEGSHQRNWSEPWEHREIIQIAAAHVFISKNVSVLSEFNVLVKPEINKNLSKYITQLTGIEQSDIDREGVTFSDAIQAFKNFCGDVKNIYCWGNDETVLRENYDILKISFDHYFDGFFDIRHVFQASNIDTSKCESGSVYKSVNLLLQKKQHYALHDVYSMSETLKFLLKENRLVISEFFNCMRSNNN